MHSAFIAYRSSRIHYCRWGSGSRLLLCLHGYGESAASFTILEEMLGDVFTIIAIDLPFHGLTEWNEGLYMNPSALTELLGQLAKTCDADTKPWTLLGYSMGGRIALSLLEMMPEKTDRLVLLAPDGLRMNPWYWLATQTGPGNRLFRLTMHHPRWFFLMLRLGNMLKMVNPSVYKFTTHYISDEQVRHDLYTRWTTMRGFRPDLKHIQSLIRSRSLPVRLIYGRHDRIIPGNGGNKFINDGGLADTASLTILPSGHRLLQIANLPAIARALGD